MREEESKLGDNNGSAADTRERSNCTKWTGRTIEGRRWQVHCGDAREVLAGFPENSFDCVITSPPYYSLRDYGVAGQIGLEESVNDYVDIIAEVMDEVQRVLQSNGLLFLNLGDTYYSGRGQSHGQDKKSNKRRFGLRPVDRSGGLGIGVLRKSLIGVPWRVALEMMSRKWVLRSTIIWHRKHSLPEAVRDRPRRSYEYVFMFAKDRFYRFNREALQDIVVEEDVWTIPARPKPNGLDTAPYPDELVEKCLSIGCGQDSAVLDPFVGSGTTMRVALSHGCDATGIDLKPEFCSHIVEQLRGLKCI